MTGAEAAARLGVSRRTLYRWHEEGYLYCWQWEQVAAMPKRARGPKRKRYSVRYVAGRHSFTKPNWQKVTS
jgi:predicted site-specific integrase-resolvase